MPIVLMNVLQTRGRIHNNNNDNSRESSTTVQSHRVLPFVTLLPKKHGAAGQPSCQPKKREAARPRNIDPEDDSGSSTQEDVALPIQQCGTGQNALPDSSLPQSFVLPKNPFIRDYGETKDEAEFCLNTHGEKRKIFLDYDDIYHYLPKSQPSPDRDIGDDETKPETCSNNHATTTTKSDVDTTKIYSCHVKIHVEEDETDSGPNNPGDVTQADSEEKTEIVLDDDEKDTCLNRSNDDSITLLNDSLTSHDESITLLKDSLAVCFDSQNNLVHEIEKSHESKEALWYSATELQFMKMRDVLLGNELEEHTSFGLGVDMEHRAVTAKRSRLAVLMEQARQRMTGQHDPTQITAQYAMASLKAWKNAHYRALQNEKHALSTEPARQLVISPIQRRTESTHLPNTMLPSTSPPRNATYRSNNLNNDEEETESKCCLITVKNFNALLRRRPRRVKILKAKMRRRLRRVVVAKKYPLAPSPRYKVPSTRESSGSSRITSEPSTRIEI